MRPLDYLGVLSVMVIWGANFAVVKFGLGILPPYLFVALRFMLVAAILLPFLRWPKRFGEIFLLSLTLGLLHFSLMFTGMKGIDAATAAIAIQLQVPIAAFFAAVAFKDKLGWRRLTGMAIAFAGVALIAGEPRFQGGLVSLALVIGAAAVWAFCNIQIKRLGDDVDAMQLNGWVALLAFPPLAAASYVVEGNPIEIMPWGDWRAWAVILFQVFLVVLWGYGIWYRAMRRYDVNQVMPFTLSVPIFGVLSGVLFLGEQLTWPMILGGLATLIGVAICVLRRPKLAAESTKGGL